MNVKPCFAKWATPQETVFPCLTLYAVGALAVHNKGEIDAMSSSSALLQLVKLVGS